jgi:hypothetical protein
MVSFRKQVENPGSGKYQKTIVLPDNTAARLEETHVLSDFRVSCLHLLHLLIPYRNLLSLTLVFAAFWL